MRQADFQEAAPSDWSPRSVTDPSSGQAFSDDGAWHFIADMLEQGHEVQAVTLRKPVGKIAYVMLIDVPSRSTKIYIKIQPMGDHVRGRSFHPSY